jgi:hypothetical protein
MSRTLTASDKSALIRLASSLPAGSAERKAVLAGLKKAAAEGTLLSRWNSAHEVALKLLSSQMKKAGWKYSRSSESALFEWSWEKADKVISLSGWAPKKGWGDDWLFMYVYVLENSKLEKVWTLEPHPGDGLFVKGPIPHRVSEAHEAKIPKFIAEAVLAVQKAAGLK